jgi:prevent-host-death family protein
VATIPHKELRRKVDEVLRRAEAGEEFTITVEGRPVARLGPTSQRRWVSGPQLREVWMTPPPVTLVDDLEILPGERTEPFA